MGRPSTEDKIVNSIDSGLSNSAQSKDKTDRGSSNTKEEVSKINENQEDNTNQKQEIAIKEVVDFIKHNGPTMEKLLELKIEDLLNWYNRLEKECVKKLEESFKDPGNENLPIAKAKLHEECEKIFQNSKIAKQSNGKQTEIKLEVINMTFNLEKMIQNYKEKMSNLVNKKQIGIAELKSNHEQLVSEMKETISKSVSIPKQKADFERNLESNISDEYEKYRKQTEAKAEKIREEITKITVKSRASYNEKMRVAPKSDEDYKKHHAAVSNEEVVLLRIVLRALCSKEEQEHQLGILQNHCDEDFQLLKIENAKKMKQINIEKASEEINKMAHKFRINYNENMQKAPKEDKDFEKLHTCVPNEQTLLLRKILREKYPSEDQERQAKILKIHCEEDFKTLKVENEKKWNALKKKEAADTLAAQEKEAEDNKKRRDAIEKKRKEVLANKKDAGAKNVASTVGSSYSQNPTSASQKAWPKAILAIHFGLEFIRCGVIDREHYKFIPNEWGDLETPNVIALTESEVLIGNQVTQEVRAQNEGHVWNMAEVLSEHVFIPKEHNKKIALMGEVVTITRELLVSLILRRIKINAEIHCQMEFNRVVITIPLWFTIVQKQSMKDAARIAGFEESFFISESTAAALCVANHEYRIKTSNNLLTVVVDPKHVEAAVYSYRNGTVEMIVSQGNLHCDGSEFSAFSKKIWKSVTHFVVRAEDTDIKLIRKVAKEQPCGEFIFISTSNFQSKHLYDAAAELAKPASNVDPVFAILLGTMLYGRKLIESRAFKLPLKLFKDKYPYALKFVRSSKEGSIFVQGRSFVGEPFKQDHEFEEDGVLSLQIKEDGGPYSFDTGILEVSTKKNSSGLTKGKYKIKFTLSFEGELTFEAQEDFNAGINKKSVQHTKTEHVFIPNGNLTETEMTELQNFMAVYHCMTSTANENPNAPLEEAKNSLQEHISEMEANLDKIQRPIVQNVIKNDIQAAKEMLQHEGTTIDLLEKKLATLTNMKSKYF